MDLLASLKNNVGGNFSVCVYNKQKESVRTEWKSGCNFICWRINRNHVSSVTLIILSDVSDKIVIPIFVDFDEILSDIEVFVHCNYPVNVVVIWIINQRVKIKIRNVL